MSQAEQQSGTCAECGAPVGAGARFCENCGRPVSPATAAVGGGTVRKPPPASTHPLPRRAEEPETALPSDCPAFHVQYNKARVFAQGVSVPFEIRLTPLRDGLEELFVLIRAGTRDVAHLWPDEYLRVGREIEAMISFRPDASWHGIYPFDIYVGYSADGRRHCFKAKCQHTIFRAREKIGRVIESLTLDLRNNINQGHAGDAAIHQHIEGLEKLQRPDDPVEDIKVIKLPDFWDRLPLVECAPPSPPPRGDARRAPPPAAAGATVCRVTLSGNGRRLHVLAADLLQLGRHRNCDIVCRVPRPAGVASGADDDPNLRINRYHARLECRAGQWRVADRGWYPKEQKTRPSTRGTFLDGEHLPPGGERELTPDRVHRLALVSGQAGDPRAPEFEAQVWSPYRAAPGGGCPDAAANDHEPACLTLRRRDGDDFLTHDFLILGRCAHLAALFGSEWGDACICRRPEGLAMRRETGCEWLRPGGVVTAPDGRSWQVETYTA